MKPYVKNLILFVLMAAVLILIGASAISSLTELELSKSTYTRTTFDFHIAAPSVAQAEAIAADGATESIFPYYAYKKAFSRDKITLMVSDKMEAMGASVLTDGTLIEGAPDEGGAMLDSTAADALGVEVGDSISFTLLGTRFTLPVSAIYLPSTLAIMEDGIVLVAASDAILSTGAPTSYGGAFIVSRDKNATAAYLSDYVGEGNVALTYEQYVSLNCGTKLPNQTEDEYVAECEAKYSEYRNEALASAKKGGGQVVDKLEAYSLLQSKVLTREKALASLTTLTMIGAFLVFSAICIIFTVSGAENDRIRRDNGVAATRMALEYSAVSAMTAILTSVAVLTALLLIAAGGYFLSDAIPLILKLAIPTAATVILTAAASFIYVKQLYKSSVS